MRIGLKSCGFSRVGSVEDWFGARFGLVRVGWLRAGLGLVEERFQDGARWFRISWLVEGWLSWFRIDSGLA